MRDRVTFASKPSIALTAARLWYAAFTNTVEMIVR